MSQARFRYALEPVLLSRRWALDALLRALAEHNERIESLARESAAIQGRFDATAAFWKTLVGADAAQPVQRFSMNVRYLGDLARQLREHAARAAVLATARDEVIAQVLAARRALDAAQEHRDDMEVRFVRLRTSADFKLADDQWNTLQTRAIHDAD